MSQVRSPLVYFGKLPGRGDFVRSSPAQPLIAMLDQWLTQTLELMSPDARWKQVYDAAPMLPFAFLGSRSRLAVCGQLAASRDGSDRRFPFIAACPLEVEEPLAFMARSPLAMSRLWLRLDALLRACINAPEPGAALQALADADLRVDTTASAHDAGFADFCELQTIGGLQAQLAQNGHRVSLRHLLLALGLLLQPVLTSASPRLEKGLLLPLPPDPLYKSLTAAYWLELVAPFLARAEFELAVFLHERGARSQLLIGFNGASPSTLRGALDAEAGAELNISLAEAEWVEQYLAGNYGLRKLSAYLEQPGFSLASTLETFREVFLG